ncbi:hypothetical protein D6825_03095 [Candidatus Woesearchaeota archaeon]|nr:MAG: hypothetical protein D6825_03095 [Candidatus Woesearchaeota archaeon]
MPIKPIAKALREAKLSVLQITIFHTLMDILTFLMISLLAAIILNFSYAYAIIITALYAAIHTRGNLKDVNYKYIESKAPELKEQLITVADNWRENNEVVKELNEEVLKKMRLIETGAFINFGKVARELIIIATVSFIIIGSSAYNVQFLDLKDAINTLKKARGDYDVNEELLAYEESQNLSEILGEESIEELGKQQLDLQLNPLKSDVEIGTVQPPEKRVFKEVPPREISASTDETYQEQIPKQYQKIVKTYFQEITKS